MPRLAGPEGHASEPDLPRPRPKLPREEGAKAPASHLNGPTPRPMETDSPAPAEFFKELQVTPCPGQPRFPLS